MGSKSTRKKRVRKKEKSGEQKIKITRT